VLPPGVVAASPLMRALMRDAAGIAPSDTRVLLTGESGTGKEVLAELLHAWSRRASGPLVKVSCAAAEAGPESELFGPGSSAGARRAGRFEEAAGGTLFLDEVADLSPAVQAKLLRAIDDGTMPRSGAPRGLRGDVRLLAATSRDLEELIAAGRFREDLFYRLNVVELHLPPLRDRTADILPLATQFIQQFSKQKPRFSASVSHRLLQYPWPGNVRELRNAMERAALLSRGEIVLPEHLPAKIAAPVAEPAPEREAELRRLEEIEREAILRALRKNGFNRTETAKELAISRRALTYKLQRMRAEGIAVDPE
jgi:DNA-binding NtrC family response regulator